MDEYKDAVREYEISRQLTIQLDKKRKSLISGCTKLDPEDYDFKVCLVRAYDETATMCRENNEYYHFSEVLEEGHAGGKYCDNCMESYILRNGALAEARRDFGNAKRKLSSLGKKAILNLKKTP